jgi:trehalose synthase
LTVPAVLVPVDRSLRGQEPRHDGQREIEGICDRLGLDATSPWITQISRFDRIKDPVGVLEAFKLVRGGARRT